MAFNQRYPGFNTSSTPAISSIINGGLPNFGGMGNAAAGNIMGQITGMPSPSIARRANSYFGVGSGMPNSDFVRNRGFDLYGQQAQAAQQQGFDNFLKLLQGYSGTLMPTVGQSIQSQQFNDELGFKERQALADRELQKQDQEFEELKWGKGRPTDSDWAGNTYDRTGKPMGYQRRFDNQRRFGSRGF